MIRGLGSQPSSLTLVVTRVPVLPGAILQPSRLSPRLLLMRFSSMRQIAQCLLAVKSRKVLLGSTTSLMPLIRAASGRCLLLLKSTTPCQVLQPAYWYQIGHMHASIIILRVVSCLRVMPVACSSHTQSNWCICQPSLLRCLWPTVQSNRVPWSLTGAWQGMRPKLRLTAKPAIASLTRDGYSGLVYLLFQQVTQCCWQMAEQSSKLWGGVLCGCKWVHCRTGLLAWWWSH